MVLTTTFWTNMLWYTKWNG